jgi:hypothetical protein
MTASLGRALVACPTYAGKEYAIDRWVEMFNALDYEDKRAYQVDNTRVSTAYYELLRSKGIDVTYLQPWPDWDRTFRRCWELILERARAIDAYWVYSVEADNIPAPESLKVMAEMALYGNCHLVTHAYPMHKTAADASGIPENAWYYHELGCMLMSRSLLEKAIEEFDDYGNIAVSIFRTCDRYMGGYIKLTNRFEVEHLDGYEMSFPNLAPSDVPGLICPTPKMPDDFGTVLPPSLRKRAA